MTKAGAVVLIDPFDLNQLSKVVFGKLIQIKFFLQGISYDGLTT